MLGSAPAFHRGAKTYNAEYQAHQCQGTRLRDLLLARGVIHAASARTQAAHCVDLVIAIAKYRARPAVGY